MIQRTLKRTLSIFLTLVLLATTFFIFDPSVLKLDAGALIGVETNAGLASITTPQAVAPETIYMKPGSNTFQYFSNINVTDGIAAGSKDGTGTVSFKNQSSTDTKLYVNNLWHKVGKTGDTYDDFAISNLQLGITGGVGAQQNITLAGLSATNATPASNATVIGRGSNSATAVLNTASILNNAIPGDVYMIEWAAVSKINGTNHVMFMYTGIYVPLLTITGATARGKHTTALTNVPKAAGFGFITGAMGYATKGNRTYAYNGTTAGVNCAPLIKFVGQQNNGNDYTIPNCDNGHSSTVSFPDGSPKTIMVVPNEYNANPNGNNYDVWTTYSSWGSYTSPSPTGANHNDVSEHGGQTNANVYAGVAYEVVDTSRFTDFSQIPNLSAGFIRYYHDRGGDDCSLAWVRCSDAPNADAPSNGVGCVGVDSSDHDDDEDKWRSRTYGLYPFGGATPTTSKGMYVMFRYNQDITTYNYPIQLNIGVGLHITSVNKDAQRKGYCAYLTSVIDNVNDSGFSTTYENMKKMACRVCDPTCTDASTVSGCTKSEIESKSQTIISSNSGALYFRVPETIYITPSNNNFQYYVNNAAGETLSPDANPEATTGTFYFNYKGASKVTGLTVESVSGSGLSSMTLGGQSLSGGKINIASVTGASTGSINTTITAGSLSAHSDAKLKWTLYYVDKTTNATQSVVAYTYCHVPLANASGNNSNSVISVTVSPNYEAAFHTNTYVCGTAWATGLYSVDSSGTGSDGNGSYKRNWLYNQSQAVPTNGNKNVSDVYNSGIGGSGYWSTNDNVSNVVGGTGTLYVDSSRYTDVGQIPDFYVGIDCNNADSKTRALYVSTGWSTSSQTIVGGDASTNRSEGWSSGGVHPSASITRGTTTDQTLYVQQWCRSWPDSTRTGTGWCYVNIHYRNKKKLRTAYDYYLQNAPILQPDYFTGSKYSDMMSYLNTVTTYLCDPENTTAQSTMDTAATNLYNQVAAMKAAVTTTSNGEATTTTFNYNDIGGNLHQNQNRSDYIKASTAYNRHYSTRTNKLITGQGTNPETINYFYGDTVFADKNNYTGYTFKYAEVTKPFNGTALVNALAAKGETTNGKGTISWDASTKTLSFTSTGGTDNYNSYPSNNVDISPYYYIPVIPNTAVTISYTATGTTAQSFAFFAGNDMKTLPSSGTWLMSNYNTGNVTYTATVPADCYYLTFRFGNQTANSTTKFTNIKMTFKTAVPDEINNAAGDGIEWKMYYDPNMTTVKYSPEGGTFNGTTAQSTTPVYYDDAYSVGKIGSSTPDAPTKTGFSFKKWILSADGELYDHNKSIEKWNFDLPEVTFSAQWTENVYDIAFNGNGNTSGTAPATIESVKYTDVVTLPANTFTKDGYEFDKWNTKADGTGTDYAAGAEVQSLASTNGATVILYAKWKPLNFTATVKAYSNTASAATTWANNTTGGTVKIGNSGTAGATATQSVAYGAKYTAIAAPATGYKFAGWCTSAPTSSSSFVSTNASYERQLPSAAADNLYARFDIEKYTINFMRNYSNSDTDVVKTLTGVYYGTSQTVTPPTRTGYTFKGWYKEQTCTNQEYGTTSPITIKDHGNDGATVTLYAKWDVKTITVKYAPGNGSGTTENGSFTYGNSYTPKANPFTAPAAKVVTLKVNGGTGVADNTTINSTFSFANWKADTNGATYNAGTAYTDNLGVDDADEVTLTAQWNQSTVTLPTPTRTGWEFKGWFTEDNGGGTERATGYKPTNSETLYAYWTVKSSTLSLYAYSNTINALTTYNNTNGGGTVAIGNGTAGASAQQDFDYDAIIPTITPTPATSPTGYKFDGWYSDQALTTSATIPAKMPDVNKTYYAKFSIIYCTVNAYAYSNTASAAATWANNATGGTVTVTADVSGTEGATSNGKLLQGKSATFTAAPKAGYHFVGWYDSSTVSGSTSVTSASITVPFTSDGATINKYARFDVNQNTLVVDPDGGSVTVGGTAYTASKSFTQNGGTTLTVSTPTKTGYTFTSWGMTPSPLNGNLNGTTYTFASDVNGKTDTIKANWSPINYTITYALDGGSHGTNHPLSAAYDSAFAVSAPTKDGYTFTGWTVTSGLDTTNAKWGTSSSPATALTSASTKCVNGTSDVYFKNLNSTAGGSVTLTANWTIKQYTVKLHAMTENNSSLGSFTESTTGGTVSGGTASGTTYNHGAAVTISASAKTGYTFAGWFSNSGMTTSVSTVPTTVTANIEYWAKFTVNKYTIAFNANTGTGSMSSLTDRVYGITYTLPQNTFTKTGYTFDGWNTAQNGSGTAYADKASVTSLSTANGATVTLYAQWKINKYTVTLHAMTEGSNGAYTESTTGGTVSGAGTFDYNTDLDISAAAKTGYTFDGWFSNSGMTTSATVPEKATANVELWAKFSIVKPQVTVYAYSNTGNSTNYENNTTGGTVKIGSGTAGASATANANYGSTVSITATPATGYQFDGWYKTVTINSSRVITAWTTQLSASATASSESVTQALTYYAKFTAKSISVSFDTTGGSITSGSATATAYYGADLTLPTVTRQGYKFLGWDENSSATSATYTGTTISADPTVNTWVAAGTNKTLYAIWEPFTYTIYLSAASDTPNNLGAFIVGTSSTTIGTSTGGTIAYKSGITKINVGDVILDCLDIQANPGYELVDVKYKVVDFAPSSGSNVTNWSGSITIAGSDKMVELPDKSQIAFIAYFQVRQYTANAYAYSNNKAPYDTYENNAVGGTVKCGESGAAGKDAMGRAYSGDTNGVTFYATAKTGYTFDGWFDNASFTGTANTNTSIKVVLNGADVRVYAKFSINTLKAYARAKYYTAGIDDATGAGINGINGGTVTVSSTSGGTATTTDINAVYVEARYHEIVTYTATRATGYEFAGWYRCSNSDDNVNIEDDIAEEISETYEVMMSNVDVRYHAKFVPVNFILVLNPNGGTGSIAVSGPVAEVTLTYGQDAVLDEDAKPTRASYSFVGWAESSTATTADYAHINSTYTIPASIVNGWYENQLTADGKHEIYAVWTIATYTVILDDQGGTGGQGQVTVTLNQPMPTLDDIPTYNGYKFKGYYLEPDGADESGKYYNADGTCAQNWNIADGKTLYAKWVCPVLMDAEYDESTGKWTYIYEDTTGKEVSADPTDAILTKEGLTDNAPDTAKELSKSDKTKPSYVKDKVDETKDINLNHYTEDALDELLKNVLSTNDDAKRSKLSQIQLNEYVAKIANFMELGISANKKDTEKVKPSIKLYETKSKVKNIKDETLTKDLSVIGENYAKPSSNEAGTFLYNDKYSYYVEEAVDYYIYTNSLTPVIALEIDDGEVGSTVETNKSSYPTNTIVSADCNASVVPNKTNCYMDSAVAATDDLSNAWFTPYTDAKIGINTDYNAKQVLYLTPTFSNSDPLSDRNEIVYTITPTDDATDPNQGATAAEIAQIPESQASRFSALNSKDETGDSITVCVCYHNSMNGKSDKGGDLGESYFQMFIDQIDKENGYYDTWLNQMHLFRQAAGANNWEIVLADEKVYPVEDETFKDTGYVLGSFAYVFSADNEPEATAYAAGGDLDAAEKAVISSIKGKVTECHDAIANTGNPKNIHSSGGTKLGFFELDIWNRNFYPAQGSYVYAHLVDRWGNYFNRVWKCFNVDDYEPFLGGSASAGYTVGEDGGSRLAAIKVEESDVAVAVDFDFVTDVDSTYENGVYTSTENVFTISTGRPSTRLYMAFVDNAGNEIAALIKTDANGNMKFTVDDLTASAADGVYSFMVNDKEVNLYAGEPALIRSASMPEIVFCDEGTKVIIKTDSRATKVQLDENGETRTFSRLSENAEVTDNGDGTLTWVLTTSPLPKGEHTFMVKGKDSSGWHDSTFTVATKSISRPVYVDKSLIAVKGTSAFVNEKVYIKAETIANTAKIRLDVDALGKTKTFSRTNAEIETTEDGTEIWTVSLDAFGKEGEYPVTVVAKNGKTWQEDNAMVAKVIVNKEPVVGSKIYSVNILTDNVELDGRATVEVLTNDMTTKLQYVAADIGTKTYSTASTEVVDNEDGTLTWTITMSFHTAGSRDITLKSKSVALGWTEADVYGTVNVTK